MYKLSIIIPHYNSKDKLIRLVKSIPEKSHYQIIVVDDNSDEKLTTSEIPHCNVIVYTNNKKGAGSARNLGLSKATGEWILFADADDYFTNDAFCYIEDYLTSDLNRKNVVFFSPTSVKEGSFDEGKRHKRYCSLVKNYLENECEETEMPLRLYYLVPWSKLISLELIRSNNIEFDDVQFSNDVMFSLKVGALANQVHADDRCIYCVTEDPLSLTGNLSKEAFHCRFFVTINYNEYLCKMGHGRYMVSMYKYLKWSKDFGVSFFFDTLKKIVLNKNPILPRKFRFLK
jgi:glycosyltransferase involved in cell wall biosynthesis